MTQRGSLPEQSGERHLHHIAGFNVLPVGEHDTTIHVTDIGPDGPSDLLDILRGSRETIIALGQKSLFQHVITSLPLDIQGDEEGPPVIFDGHVEVNPRGEMAAYDAPPDIRNTITLELVPTVGRVESVTSRENGGAPDGVDGFEADSEGAFISVFGGIFQAHVQYGPDTPE